MKKLIPLSVVIVLLVSVFTIQASAINASMTSSVKTPTAGETFTVTFRVDGKVTAFQGSLNYEADVVTLKSVSSRCGDKWYFNQTGDFILGYDLNAKNPQTAGLFNATFMVNKGVKVDTPINISFSAKLTPADGSGSDTKTGTFTSTVAAPLSTDNTLSALKVSNATLSPAFNKNTTSYSCGTVGFDVAKLGVTATAAGDGATVNVSGANLKVGKNTVSIVVKAASGDTKTYTITVEREQDPDYKASDDTKLAGIEVSTGTLSPAFNVAQKEYVVYVPYEVEKFSVKGTAASEVSKGVQNVEDAALKVGTNELALKVTAEDDTVGEYKIYVVRMDKFGGIDTVGLPASLVGTTPEEPTEDEPAVTPTTPDTTTGVEYWMIAVGAAAGLLIGFLIGMIAFKSKKSKGYVSNYYDDYDDLDEEPILEEESYTPAHSHKENVVDEYLASNSSDEVDLKFGDEPSIDEYIDVDSGAKEEKTRVIPQPVQKAPGVTFANLTGQAKPENKPEESRVHYIAYEEYIDNLDNNK